jgi:hypothetical protein
MGVPAKARTPLRSIPDLELWELDHHAGTAVTAVTAVIAAIFVTTVTTVTTGTVNETKDGVEIERKDGVEIEMPARDRNEFHIVKFTNHD